MVGSEMKERNKVWEEDGNMAKNSMMTLITFLRVFFLNNVMDILMGCCPIKRTNWYLDVFAY